MNLLSKLPFLSSNDEEEDLRTDEEIQAELKADRIKFHRERVRNGPVTFTTLTNGQIRRAQRRDLERQQKKVRRRQVANYFERQRGIASLRGSLQAVRVLPYADPNFTPPHAVIERAQRSLEATFGKEATLAKAAEAYAELTGRAA